MRLLLTSNGLCNKSIIKVLKKWVGNDIRIAFIPTAANFSNRNKKWLIENYIECYNIASEVYIVDIAALSKREWLPRLKKANVIVMGGGSAPYLMKYIISSGLDKELPKLLKDRVYVGISAGSMVVSDRLYVSSEFLFDKKFKTPPKGLGYVAFNVRAHFNSKSFPKAADKYLKIMLNNIRGDMYALDNQSAVVVDDMIVYVVSEGEWKLYRDTKFSK